MRKTRKSCRRSVFLTSVALMFPIIITLRYNFEVHAASMRMPPNTIVRRTSARKGRRIQADKNNKNNKVDNKNKNANNKNNNNKNNNNKNNNNNNNKNTGKTVAKTMPPTSRPTSRYSAPPSSRPTSQCRGKLSDVVNFHNGFFSRRAYVQYVQDQCPELEMRSDKFSHLPSTLVQTYWETVCTVQNDDCRVDNLVAFSDLVGVTNNALTGSSDVSVLSRLCNQVDAYCNTITKGPTPSPTVALTRKPSPSPTTKPTTSPTSAPTSECRSNLSDAVDNHNGYFSKQAYVDFIQHECTGIAGLENSEHSDHAFTHLPQGAVQIYWQTVCAIQNSDCGIDTLIPFTDMVNADLTSNTQTSDGHQTVIARLCHQVKDMCIEATRMTDLPTLSTSSSPSMKPTDQPTQHPTHADHRHTDYPTNQELDEDPQKETVPPIQITQTPTATMTATPTENPTKSPTLPPTSSPSKDAVEKPTVASTPSIVLAPKVEVSFSMFIFEADESENEESVMSGGLVASSSIKPFNMNSIGLGVPSSAEQILGQANKALVQSVLSSLAAVLCEETDYIILNSEGGTIFHDHCSGRRNIEGLATMQHQTVFITDFLGGLFDDMLKITNRRVLSLDKSGNAIYIDWTVWTIKYPVLIQNTLSMSEKSRSYEKSSTDVMTNIQKVVDRVVTSALITGKVDKEMNKVHNDPAFFAASPIGLEVETFEQIKTLAEEVNPPIGVIEPDVDTEEKGGYSFFHGIRIVGFIFLVLVVGVSVHLVKAGRKNKEAMFHVDEAPAAAREVNLATNEGLDLMLQTSHLGSRRID